MASASSWSLRSTLGLGPKRHHLDPLAGDPLTASGASGSAGSGRTALFGSGSSRSSPATSAGSSSKRAGPAPPAFPRPRLHQGEAVFSVSQYASMERPAPTSAAPNLLYVDLRDTQLTPEDVLHAAFPVVGKAVVGFQFFAAAKTLGLVFSSPEKRNEFVDKPIGSTGLTMYSSLSSPVLLCKLTLQGVPFWDVEAVKTALPKLLAPAGELVFLAPMVTVDGFLSDQWHATIKITEKSPPPPTLIEILGQSVIVDIPGQRRFCRHCEHTLHVKPSCRQGQRQRQRAAALRRDQEAAQAALAAMVPSTTDTTTTTTTTTSTATDPKSHPSDAAWDEDMSDVQVSFKDQFRTATDIVTRAAEGDPLITKDDVLLAQHFLDTANFTGGSGN